MLESLQQLGNSYLSDGIGVGFNFGENIKSAIVSEENEQYQLVVTNDVSNDMEVDTIATNLPSQHDKIKFFHILDTTSRVRLPY